MLALTACLKKCSVAMTWDGRLKERDYAGDSVSNLAAIVHDLARENSVDLKKIDGIIVASGPGSFTGIRAAHAFGQGMATALQIPILAMDYFTVVDEICRQRQQSVLDPDRIILIETAKGHLYFKHGSLEPGVNSCENISAYIRKNQIKTILGDSSLLCKNEHAVFIDDFRRAKYLLAFAKLLAAESSATPLYINAAAKYGEN
ncbi:MAG: tRNA (adenosine(37)-N6)-threonylcarbamoyltransferase complex dimerization subunit type 1 TsaB [Holosporaceae bacterium]|nr:tRNA (adenosine(37)-N6)-threonylcarbamoyltransferase complex dimerization subunit type 1 TsaB [Holosporaceae bacterium]